MAHLTSAHTLSASLVSSQSRNGSLNVTKLPLSSLAGININGLGSKHQARGLIRNKPFQTIITSAIAAPPRSESAAKSGEGHSALRQGLGNVGEVPPALVPWLLRLAHVKSKITGGDSNVALQESARGVLLWKVGFYSLSSFALRETKPFIEEKNSVLKK